MTEIYVLVSSGGDEITSIIGVYSTPDNANTGIFEDHHPYVPELIKFDDVRDSSIEWVKHYRDSDGDEICYTLQYFELDE